MQTYVTGHSTRTEALAQRHRAHARRHVQALARARATSHARAHLRANARKSARTYAHSHQRAELNEHARTVALVRKHAQAPAETQRAKEESEEQGCASEWARGRVREPERMLIKHRSWDAARNRTK
eukprot:6175712-Pleurochrysis_carterae.AAC.1